MHNKMKNVVRVIMVNVIMLGSSVHGIKNSVETRVDVPVTSVISSKKIEVIVDNTFPRVVQYAWKETGEILYGQPDRLTQIIINGREVTPEVKFSNTSNTARYEMTCPSCVLEVEMKVVDDVLQFMIQAIKESGDFRIHTIEIPHHSIVSVRSTQPQAMLATAIIDADKSRCGDTFTPVTASSEIIAGPRSAAYAILSSGQLAAAIETNSIYDYVNDDSKKVSNGRVMYQVAQQGHVVSAGLWSGQWTWRADESDKTEQAPHVKVILTTDRNGDGLVDWQDGAIAARDIMPAPRGSERMPERVAQHICFNFASIAGNPFLKALDNVKRVYYITDGLGQMVLLKGYQSEGHDSAHSDFGGNIGRRMGGKKDLNILVNEGARWNAEFGPHINCTESYPEAHSFSDDFVYTDWHGWGWLDQSYKIRHRRDLVTGFFESRIKEMQRDVPGFRFVYMDVYYGDGWEGLEMARTVQQAGLDVTTEFPSQIEHSAIWSHWSVDMTYGPDRHRGINSQIVRFIRNHQKDMFLMHPLLGHAELGDFEGWQGKTDFYDFIFKLYSSSLPAKYLQHFLITKWSDSEICFTDGVRVTNAAGKRQIFKGERLVLDGDVYLLPWDPTTEKKLYHWNVAGGTTAWMLPKTWKSKTVKQYRLTDTGRVFVADVPVMKGWIAVHAESKQPYVLYPSTPKKQPLPKWGQGGFVKDPGFNDRTHSDWTIDGAEGAVSVDVDDHGRTALKIASDTGLTTVSQTLKGLKPGVYVASVWVEVQQGRRKASLIVSPDGGTTVDVWADHSFAQNYFGNSEWNRTRMQRMQVLFDVPTGKNTATLKLTVGPGQSSVRFDDVRVVAGVRTRKPGIDFFEDFENVVEGWYPFTKGDAGAVTDPMTHLSELHAPYTNAGWNKKLIDDTLEGQWSLKSHNERKGRVYQTLPQTIRFLPGHRYEVSFDYQSAYDDDYVFVIGAGGGEDVRIVSKIPIKKQYPAKLFTVTVTPGDDPDVWVGLERIRPEGKDTRKEVDFVMDNFAVREIGQ